MAGVNELGQKAREEDADLGIGQIAEEALSKAGECAHRRPVYGRGNRARLGAAGSSERLDPKPYEIERPDQLQTREGHGRRAHHRCHADGCGKRPDRQASADAETCSERRLATMDEHILGDHGGVWARYHDHDGGDGNEYEQVNTHSVQSAKGACECRAAPSSNAIKRKSPVERGVSRGSVP